ncbi:MAG: ATP-binding protein [Haliscomenobacter sp.]|nr:ATP-binding protein [Haliscomenobacter sp.]MBK9491980.1 ATP-binding protein [Haliscomenobacter sp.]
MNNYPDYSPFKLLETYGAGDTTYFFGREKEIIQLNDLLIRSKFVLLYGASGTGKTSLIQCGMSGMYSPRDWYPLFIRRNDNFIDSIHAALFREYQNWNPNCTAKELDSFQNQSLRNQLKTLFAQSYRPIYLILDQFEEIFTLSLTKAKEAKDFLTKYSNWIFSVKTCFVKSSSLAMKSTLPIFTIGKTVPFPL